jgi:hypothetical protein
MSLDGDLKGRDVADFSQCGRVSLSRHSSNPANKDGASATKLDLLRDHVTEFPHCSTPTRDRYATGRLGKLRSVVCTNIGTRTSLLNHGFRRYHLTMLRMPITPNRKLKKISRRGH